MSDGCVHKTVLNEGCDLHYWHRGSGPLLVFIPGGNGHGRQYYPIMTALENQYTCVTFDRRQMSSSTVEEQRLMSLPQQGRDVVSVIKAMGRETAILFGSSLGGIICLQIARDTPEVIEHMICHEPPVTALLPEASEIVDWFVSLYNIYRSTGSPKAAQVEFEKRFVGMGDAGLPPMAAPEWENVVNFWENEFLGVQILPDLFAVKKAKVSVGVMNGARSRDAFYARASIELGKVLECPGIEAPGHHQGFEVETEAFVPCFLRMVEILKVRKDLQQDEDV